MMREALRLARRGREGASPNPLVGAVVVRHGTIVGRGWHRRCGGPHAEIAALDESGKQARGSDLYVTLEPCGHQGRTPPCADAIVEAGVGRVFYAITDPNPQTRGRGPRKLRRLGIPTHRGLLEDEARELNLPYFYWRRTGLPWVILKWAMSLDGKIATAHGDSRWISGEASRRYVHSIRRRVDAVLVGTETFLRDDPNLLPRPRRGRTPSRVVLDRRGRLPLDLQVFQDGEDGRIYATTARVGRRRREAVEKLGLDVLELPERDGGIDLKRLLAALGSRDVSQLLVEGGGKLHGALLDAGLAHEVIVFVAPKIIGGAEAPVPVGGQGVDGIASAPVLRLLRSRRLGQDLVWEGRLASDGSI